MAVHITLEPKKVINIDGKHIEEVVLSPWRITIVLRSGKRIVIEPDIYPEITTCRKSEWDCYMENIKLSIYEEGEG